MRAKKSTLWVTVIVIVVGLVMWAWRKPGHRPDGMRMGPGQKSLGQLWLEMQATTQQTLYYMKGYAYAFIPGQRPRRLFGLEGYNIRRLIETPEKDGYFVATREIVFYTDPRTGEILWEWENPFTGERVEVFHITNDPVNFRVRIRDGRYYSVSLDGQREFGEMRPPQEWEDFYVWYADVFPFYPLPGWKKKYTAAELFDFYVPKRALHTQGPPEVMVSWTRVGPWLPWMHMDDHEGVMIYHARSRRFTSWNALPDRIKRLVKEKYPLYMKAPDKVDPHRPNATSWTVYMEEMKKRKARHKER